jgi:hypothetical protein
MEAVMDNPAELSDEQLDCVSGGGGANADALVTLVLANVANDQDNVLQDVMNQMQALTNEKMALRNQMGTKRGR